MLNEKIQNFLLTYIETWNKTFRRHGAISDDGEEAGRIVAGPG